ncbi:MAG: hypothetical protein HXK70_02145 [Clostridiales bacterium]|nr:hypothetical protein [Clostridiales bacterium]
MDILSNNTIYSSDDNNIDIVKFSEYVQLESSEQIYLNYNIFQNINFFKFGIDSFLLSKFFLENTTIKHNNIADFCSGTGIVGIFSYLNILHNSYCNENISIRKTNIENVKIDFFEIQNYFANLNYRNCSNIYNQILDNSHNTNTYLKNPFNVFNASIDTLKLDINFKDKYSCILSNPPYMKENKGISTNSKEKDIAKIAKKDFLDSFFSAVKFCLIDKGELYIVHKPENLSEIIIVANKYNIELKSLQFITNTSNKQPSLFLAKFVKNGNRFLNILPIKSIN